jgi:hypothetical protein
VTGDQAAHPRWRRDGLYYLRVDTSDTEVMAVPVTWAGGEPDFGPARSLFKVPNVLRANRVYDVSADGQKFALVVAGEADRSPLSVRFRIRR